MNHWRTVVKKKHWFLWCSETLCEVVFFSTVHENFSSLLHVILAFLDGNLNPPCHSFCFIFLAQTSLSSFNTVKDFLNLDAVIHREAVISDVDVPLQSFSPQSRLICYVAGAACEHYETVDPGYCSWSNEVLSHWNLDIIFCPRTQLWQGCPALLLISWASIPLSTITDSCTDYLSVRQEGWTKPLKYSFVDIQVCPYLYFICEMNGFTKLCFQKLSKHSNCRKLGEHSSWSPV